MAIQPETVDTWILTATCFSRVRDNASHFSTCWKVFVVMEMTRLSFHSGGLWMGSSRLMLLTKGSCMPSTKCVGQLFGMLPLTTGIIFYCSLQPLSKQDVILCRQPDSLVALMIASVENKTQLGVVNLVSEAAFTVHYLFQLSQRDVEKAAGKGERGQRVAGPWALGSNESHPK